MLCSNPEQEYQDSDEFKDYVNKPVADRVDHFFNRYPMFSNNGHGKKHNIAGSSKGKDNAVGRNYAAGTGRKLKRQ